MGLESLTQKLGIGILTATLINPSISLGKVDYTNLNTAQNIRKTIEAYEEETRFESKDGMYSIRLEVAKQASYILFDNDLERISTRMLINKNSPEGKWTYVIHLDSMINPKTGMIEQSDLGIDDFRKAYWDKTVAISIFWRPRFHDLETEFSNGREIFRRNNSWIKDSETKIKIGGQEGMMGRFSIGTDEKKIYNEYIIVHVNGRTYEIFLRVNEEPQEHEKLLDKIKNIRFKQEKEYTYELF